MFGYVTIDKMELKFKEYYSYKGYYCGLCMSLKEKYSQIGRLTLNYDMTFLILLLSSLYEPKNETYKTRCIVHPAQKQLIIKNEITEYAAGINILLAYYNLQDNWADERDVKSLMLAKILKRNFKKSAVSLIEKEKFIREKLNNIGKLEKENTDDVEATSNEFGHLMEEIVLYKHDEWESTLRKVGFFLGKYIYLLDAYEDMENDKKNNSYNPFLNVKVDNIDQYANDMIMLNLSFLSNSVEKLPLVQDKAIIDNIIYSGILTKLKSNKTKDKEQNTHERSI